MEKCKNEKNVECRKKRWTIQNANPSMQCWRYSAAFYTT